MGRARNSVNALITMPVTVSSIKAVLKILFASPSSPSPSFMLARGAPPIPIRLANACIIKVIGKTIPSAASASIPPSPIFATNILSTMLYKKVISWAITAGIVSLNISGSIFPFPSCSVEFAIFLRIFILCIYFA